MHYDYIYIISHCVLTLAKLLINLILFVFFVLLLE